MKRTLLSLSLIISLAAGAIAQNSSTTSQVQNQALQNQSSQNASFILENGQIIGTPPANVNEHNQGPLNNTHHEKNGNHALGHYWDTTGCGLNYVQATVLIETRYNQYALTTFGHCMPTNDSIHGLPTNAVVVKAVVWWEVSYESGSSTTPTLTITNPNGSTSTLTATMAGQDGPKCWGEVGTRCFRVELPIASNTSGGAIGCDGPYNVSISGNTCWEVDGLTVFLVYQDPAATYTGSIYLYDGMISMVAGTITQTITGMNVCANSTVGNAFSLSSDWQDDIGNAPHDAKFDNIQYTGLYGNGFDEFDMHAENFNAGQTTCVNGYSSTSDCYGWYMTGAYFQTACMTCTVTNGSGVNVVDMDSTKTNTICNQANGSAWVIASGGSGSPYHYNWSTGATTDTATGLAAGWYTVTVYDFTLCHSAVDSVLILPSASVLLTLTGTNISCGGLSDGVIIADTSGGHPPFTYSWSPSGGNGLTASNLAAGQYTLLVTDSTGCTKTDTLTLTQPPILAVTSAPTGELCFNTATGTVPLNVTGGTPGYNYVWSPAQGNLATAINLFAGIYNVTVIDANGCTTTNNSIVTEPPALTIMLSPNTTICVGQSTDLLVTIGGGTPPYTYSWSNGSLSSAQTVNPIVTTIYSVTATDFNGCTITAPQITINVNPPLTIVAEPTAQICQGQSATISAIATGGTGHYTYTWDQGVGVATGIVTVTPTVTTIYTVTVTDSCTTPDVITTDTVVVNSAPVVNFTGYPLSGCSPLDLQFTNSTTSSLPIISWDWNYGDGTAHGDSASPSHLYYAAGLFNVTLTAISSSNCISSLTDSAYIDVYPLPVSRFLINPLTTTIISPEIGFIDQSQGADTVYYNFGDGSSSTLRNPYHSYGDTGSYWITEYVMNQYGCTDSSIGTVTVTLDFEFYIPNSFSPNGKGLNEYFTGVGRGVSDYQMNIFDRWGELLFSTTSLSNGWDGTYNGVQVKQDVYIYDIKLRDSSNNAHQYVGQLNLLR
jgi:gliding motility-associated-like protein